MFIDHLYEVLEHLGTGAWANVYKVRDIRSGKLYSLKLFQYVSSDDLYSRFSAEEMHHITRLEHPNLSHTVDFGHVADHIYYISEYFEGKPLTGVKFNKAKLGQIYDIAIQICYALHALHTQNILHKDLKLENVLYRTEGNTIILKLIDYGFSKVDTTKDSQAVSGTLPYLAPEIYLGKPASKASDFYALGVILYKLTTGSFPFSVDQINALITGGNQYFIPSFPSELNKDIPLSLEKFILRLLDQNPDNRFASCEEIVHYINRTQSFQYPFSVSWSMINTLHFNSYLVRDKYSHQILDYIPAVEKGNGKIISVTGGDGLGKDSIISLFRYHLLSGKYFIFDYTCSKSDHEAFFALIKEFVQSLSPEELQEYSGLKTISEKFRCYLFGSEQEAKTVSQTSSELKLDFESVKSLLIDLSINKPIIFIIRNFQYVHHNTIDFINFMSSYIVKHRIMIVITCNDYNKINQIDHTVLMNIPTLNLDESRNYINRLLSGFSSSDNRDSVPEELINEIYRRSAGNPYFIVEILIDLMQRRKLYYDKMLHYPADLSDYQLSSRLLQSIHSRLSHLKDVNYLHLQKLSVVQTPLTRELIIYILKIKDSELYSLLNDGIYHEILKKQGKNYYFTFQEAKQRLFNECRDKTHKLVSKRVLKFYADEIITDFETCRGLIANAFLANDLICARLYYLRYYDMLNQENEQEQAFFAILNVLNLDFNPELSISLKDLISDVKKLQEKMEFTGFYERAKFIIQELMNLPDFFEKYYLLGTINILAENIQKALEYFSTGERNIITGRQQLLLWLAYAQVFAKIDPSKMILYVDKALKQDMTLELHIAFVDRLAVYHSLMKNWDMAIKTIADFLEKLPPEHNTDVMYRLIVIHNDLGVFYSNQKNIDEADEHLFTALNISRRYNINRYLGLIYNNISDLYLKQGLTVISEHYSELAYKYSDELNFAMSKALSLLNQGEAKIKMGDFVTAEQRLLECEALVLSKESTNYLQSVKRNLALAKSKIKGFGHYFSFIMDNEPELISCRIKELNPLVKTYFYYLHEIGNAKKLRRLLSKNVHINYKHIHEEEFYHNALALASMAEKDFEGALNELKIALRHAGEINNNYAIAVFYVLQIRCYYGLKDVERARELTELALPKIKENHYRYWECELAVLALKIDLLVPDIPLRSILRKVNEYLDAWSNYEYYQLNVELYQVKIQIFIELKQEELAEAEYANYKKYLENITENIRADDRQNYLSINLYYLNNLRKFNLLPIASRTKDLMKKWNEMLFNITNINSIDRIKFLIEKGLIQVFSPWQFYLMKYSSKVSSYTCFQSYNTGKENTFNTELLPYIERAFKIDNLVILEQNNLHFMVVPFQIGSKRIGFLLLSDKSEMPFTKQEMSLMRDMKQHLAALLVRIEDFSQITLRIQKMNQLMAITHELMRIVNINELERAIVSACIDFTNSTRGFLIKRDSDGAIIYTVQLNAAKQILPTVSGVSKTVLSLSQNTQEIVSTFNAVEDNRFKSAISVQDYVLHTIFCAPIIVDNNVYGYIYLDNLNDNNREMYLNTEIIKLLLEQITIALKNAMLYENLLQKNNELNTFETLKDEFMAIVSHELNTPLTTLQGYVTRLKRNLFADEEEKKDIINKIENSVKKIILTINDITTMNTYNLAKSLPFSTLSVQEILEIIYQEVQILSRKRKMFIKLEIEKDLPPIKANWEAFHLMIYNLVLNAIRFTNDFGTVIIGARKSAFQSEKIDGKESLVIYVQDNGIGIPEYQLKNVFRKFYELNEIYAHKSGTIEYRSSGLGLGLATSKRIAELHSGKIWIKSKENEGTTVFVTIPIKQSK